MGNTQWKGFVLAFVVSAQCAVADYIVVKRAAPIKNGPSAAADAVARVGSGQILELKDDRLSGNYVSVRSAGGVSGWIYKGFVDRHRGSAPPPAAAASETLKVRVFDVGQGDAILITCPDGDHQMLIDTGDTRYPGAAQAFKNAITEHLRPADTLEIAVGTHPHSDHIGSMDWLLRTRRPALYIDCGKPATSATFKRVEAAIAETGVLRRSANTLTLVDVDFCPRADVSAVLLRPAGFGAEDDPNDNSVVVRVNYFEDSFLFVGDTEAGLERQLLDDPATKGLLDCDFLKVGHHGSETSSTKEFLDAVTPRIAAISAGRPGVSTNAGYRHPRRRTVDRLALYLEPDPTPERPLTVYDSAQSRWLSVPLDVRLYSTSRDGDLLFESNGDGIVCRTAR
ncbi:MAG TPA: MBL fold metallo-hydrolase [Phycisphaerales bacterium]|nr:MBL fold metallo-hydrolase [Phycisphaerales bacterium]